MKNENLVKETLEYDRPSSKQQFKFEKEAPEAWRKYCSKRKVFAWKINSTLFHNRFFLFKSQAAKPTSAPRFDMLEICFKDFLDRLIKLQDTNLSSQHLMEMRAVSFLIDLFFGDAKDQGEDHESFWN